MALGCSSSFLQFSNEDGQKCLSYDLLAALEHKSL